jgi:hypothetical protein
MEHGASKHMTNNRNKNGDGHKTDIITNTSLKTRDQGSGKQNGETEEIVLSMNRRCRDVSGYVGVRRKWVE